MSSIYDRLRRPRAIAVAAAAGLVLTAAACSSGSSNTATPGGTTGASGQKVTISIDCAPPQAQQPVQHKEWLEDVGIFEKANPNITINSIYNYPCEQTASFTSMLRGGTEPDIFYTYFTDLPQVLLAGQAADITPYVNSKTVPNLADIAPSSMKAVTAGKTLYGLPTSNYTQGLIYNRKLFQQAGLNPDNPPTTWAEVETDATAIAKLGNGIEGWGEYSAGNNGGWHFSSYIDAVGGSMVNTNTAPATASFNTADAQQILQALHNLRFKDNAMSASQGLAWGALQQQFGAGKLGMYIAAPDDIYNVIVPTDKGNLSDIGMGPLPSLTGTAAGSLSGGNDFVFAKHDTPAQIEAGIKWIDFENLTPGTGQFNFTRQKADGFPVGFPEPELFVGPTGDKINSLRAASATINTAYYQPFIKAQENGDGEPTDAQAVYKTLDPVMLAVLTEQNADIPTLLKTATSNVNTLLQNAG
ncbi:extracellular solute-binding protein [Trebonia kvetii]|uniref:Extracellular solute-binding protein n=1 Tax=Trebonia kvetii TaxID=2480626 RepID=A0A6P2C0F4_9ACTN|nr:extracellular solute-binding protein [Trebonia kvetii]TVZ04427.1 extracellular solute-binding protein [Trebonia kvetii]